MEHRRPRLNVQLVKSGPTNGLLGRAWFSNGTVRSGYHLPRRQLSRFTMIGAKVHFDHMDLVSDGADP